MEISDFTNTNQGQTLSTALSQPGENGDEFNSFLQLLTAQIRNQDPLSPLDSTQFVEQLATFSTLEQQVRSNSNLEGIAQGINQLQSLIANQWLGETVSVETDTVPYRDRPLEFGFDAPSDADRAVLTVYDPEDRIIWSDTLDPRAGPHSWNGETASGITAASNETYRFKVDLYRGEEFIGSEAPRFATTVIAVAPPGSNNSVDLLTDLGIGTGLDAVRILDR